MRNSLIHTLLSKIKNYFKAETKEIDEPRSKDMELTASIRELEALLTCSRKLLAITEQTIAALRSGQLAHETKFLNKEIQLLKSELTKVSSGSDNSGEANKKEKYGEYGHLIDNKLQVNLQNLKEILGGSEDIIYREFEIGGGKQTGAFVCFIDGLGDKQLIDEGIVRPLIHSGSLSAADTKEITTFNAVLDAILSGKTVLFVDGSDTALSVSAAELNARNVEEPDTERSVRGPREGFVEVLRDNTALVRRIIKNPKLVFESFKLGKQTHTEINIAYIKGIVNPNLINEVKIRLNRIDTDSILESGYIEALIEDDPFSLFPTVGNSEKPDKIAAKLLEGRVAIFVNGTPFVLTIPYLFTESFQASEDYYNRYLFSSLIRLIRFLGFFLTIVLPSLYVGVASFHPAMLPHLLLITMSAASEGVPFSPFVEILITGIMIEVLREAGIRMPGKLGQALNIVGALVMGDLSVKAGLISAHVVIIAAMTGITNFLVPTQQGSIIFLRLLFIVFSTILGFFGIGVCLMMVLGHLCSLRSFGVPYMGPMAPAGGTGLKDTFIIAPLWARKFRSQLITWGKSEKSGK
ncbi:hypothetical protein P22_1400 [Propionispora sp. 2/2-37]|uniref:spore germination protein n=1 Tax=Propionispora sp. 2/2-37 TaxID=1677858 RepID=UPI0006C3AF33|nr:spore germination protein [Propionispora sp. 2/2-37]CUH95330.1 hypothetical protein P22_1400 [Propionispora sp. 2/2-37]